MRHKSFVLTPYFIERAKSYWREGFNTFEIALKLEVHESSVHNAIARGRKP